ncbi:recombinase family protein [Pengzhenrongella phosphoraccumulans]|uniref:recombinase family protein n=1 Tax=Pengzhenrongella phosphoraccumulans TaxID=3114394 RepID=UPI00388F886A
MKTAAIYARISSDPTGQALGVARQVEDCRRLAKEKGWTVAEEYIDNDLSAYKGNPRPAYERMLADLRDGYRDAVIVYNLDRLTRQPIQLEEFSALCERAGVRHVATVTADIDLGNDDGLFMARIFAAFAAKESGRRSQRILRKHQQLAEQGLPNGGNLRPYGYGEDRITVVESEAEVIRALALRYLAGESVRSLVVWLNAQQVPTVTGVGEWRTPTLRRVLSNPRTAGLREHNGQIVGEAVWDAIITPAQRTQVLAMFASKKVSGRRAPRRYLLSGMLRCGKCGNRLFSSVRGDRRRYVCLAGPDHGGCGRLTAVAEPVETLIVAMVLHRLDSPEVADALAGRASVDDRQMALMGELEADRTQMDELALMYSAREISAAEWRTAREPIDKRIRDTERQLAQFAGSSALAGLVGNGQELAEGWADQNLERQATIVAALLDYAIIGAGVSGARRFEPSRLQPVWRL